MNLPVRARVLGRLQSCDPRLSVRGKSVNDLPALRARLTPSSRGPMALITGRPASDVRIDTLTAELPGRQLPVRRYIPTTTTAPRPVIVDFHSGGFVIGTASLRDWFNSHLAVRAGSIIASVDYRLAPEYAFPHAYDDAVDATRWVADQAGTWGGDPDRLAVLGDSAGANLAAGVGLHAADDPDMPAITSQVLAYGAYDFVGEYSSAHDYAHEIFLNRAEAAAMVNHYLSDEDRRDVRASPLLSAGLAGSPPTLIIAAERDILRDESLAYTQALRDAGVATRYTLYPRTAHGFLSCPGLYPSAIHALADTARFLRDRFAQTTQRR